MGFTTTVFNKAKKFGKKMITPIPQTPANLILTAVSETILGCAATYLTSKFADRLMKEKLAETHEAMIRDLPTTPEQTNEKEEA